MRTTGVDLSAPERSTALATIEWQEAGRARVGALTRGIDAPFGRPEPMVAAIHSRPYGALVKSFKAS